MTTPLTEQRHNRCELCPLSMVKSGVAVRVRRFSAEPEVVQRLREIGLVEGAIVRLLATHANVICLVCNTRLALSNALAKAILVEAVAAV